jgi:hypothetical protein
MLTRDRPTRSTASIEHAQAGVMEKQSMSLDATSFTGAPEDFPGVLSPDSSFLFDVCHGLADEDSQVQDCFEDDSSGSLQEAVDMQRLHDIASDIQQLIADKLWMFSEHALSPLAQRQVQLCDLERVLCSDASLPEIGLVVSHERLALLAARLGVAGPGVVSLGEFLLGLEQLSSDEHPEKEH